MDLGRSIRAVAVIAVMALSLTLAATAGAASPSAIYQTCASGGSLDKFSKADLQNALGGVPADLDEYYACSAQISAALVDKATRSRSGSGVKGAREKLRHADPAALLTPAEQRKIERRVARETALDEKNPLASSSKLGIRGDDGHTLASISSPGSPTLLVVGLFGLVLLLTVEVFGRARERFAKSPATSNPQRDHSA